ncbi:hypothetical protein BZA77DRAFT_121549 [Pyronema omphalodes]|nr:hypothetical protein BZA77DRAFT_121549 [Pyronema omphalodes]
MGLWPFKRRKRSTTAEEKRPAIDIDAASIHSVRSSRIVRSIPSRAKSFLKRNSSRRNGIKEREFAPEITSDLVLEPPLEQHEDVHMMDYDYHANHLHADVGRDHNSSDSSHRPHKQSSLIRRLSKRKDRKVQPPSAYETHLGRHSSRASRRYGPDNRPMTSSSSIPRSSIESNISSRAYKIKPLDLLLAYPTLHYEDETSPTSDRYQFQGGPSLIPSRTTSRRTNSRNPENSRYKSGPLTSVENLGDHRRRVDDLADELDAKGLREAMERDQRRRERKQREYDERQRIQHEKDTAEGQYQHHDQHHEQKITFDPNPAFQQHRHLDYNQPESSAQAQERERDRIGYAMDGTQTPLSWFNDSNSELSVARRRDERASEFARVETPQSLENYGRQPMTPPPEPIPEVVVDEASPERQKQNPWTSFIKRATSARIKKEQSRGSRRSSGSQIRANHSTLLTDSEGEDHERNIEPRQSHTPHQQISEAPRTPSDPDDAPDDLRAPFPRPNPHHLAVQDFHHRPGQTPGTHIAKEVVLAMNALATGKVHEDKDYLSTIRYSEDFDEFHDELRDEVPYQVQPYHHANGSSKSNLSAGLRNANGTYARYSPLDDRPESRETREVRELRELREGRDSRESRYSPVPIRTSGAASPDHGGARSIMSTSLASIDSEGSWLSGRLNSRLSVQQISPLRTSASSLRKRFREMEDHEAMVADDDYFSGVDIEKHEDTEEGGARLDLDDSEDDIMADEEDDEDERERERDMWREGMERKVKMEDAQRAMSREATLDELPGESSPTANIDSVHHHQLPDESPPDLNSVHHDNHRAREIVNEPDNYDFDTPTEQPAFKRTETVDTTNQPFSTPLEHPAHSYTRTTTQSTILPDSFQTPLEYLGPNGFKRSETVGTMNTTNEPFTTPLEHPNHHQNYDQQPSYFRTVESETNLEHQNTRERS